MNSHKGRKQHCTVLISKRTIQHLAVWCARPSGIHAASWHTGAPIHLPFKKHRSATLQGAVSHKKCHIEKRQYRYRHGPVSLEAVSVLRSFRYPQIQICPRFLLHSPHHSATLLLPWFWNHSSQHPGALGTVQSAWVWRTGSLAAVAAVALLLRASVGWIATTHLGCWQPQWQHLSNGTGGVYSHDPTSRREVPPCWQRPRSPYALGRVHGLGELTHWQLWWHCYPSKVLRDHHDPPH